eukprot:TRINITY_DN22778_c0_g1_i1.p1 TRINITY_DN22778_c0_g1~~TRINITY_DN22778_c0_g1_i1.p1  ORF type:complete len:311 (+),score=129.83 TRINITY_DN22778_c0_g1_i1:79-1011(+)
MAHRIQMVAKHLLASASDGTENFRALPTSGSYPTGILRGQVAIITGSGQGIGEAAALLFAKEGAKVVVSDIDEAKAKRVADAIRAAGGQALAVAGDVTDPAFPERIVKETVGAFGGLNILVNNAGYTWDGVIHKMSDKQWDAMLAVHNTAPFRLIRAAAPYMRDEAKKEIDAGNAPQPRCIINVSSTSGLHGNAGQINYATAKMGIVGLTKTVAKEWGAFGIRCNAVAFGFIDTRLTRPKEDGAAMMVDGKKVALGIPVDPMVEQIRKQLTPLRRNGTADEAAGSLLLLASPFASYITGHTLEVTGGAGI